MPELWRPRAGGAGAGGSRPPTGATAPGGSRTPPRGSPPVWEEELPTVPPPSRAGPRGLRWATPGPAATPTAPVPVVEMDERLPPQIGPAGGDPATYPRPWRRRRRAVGAVVALGLALGAAGAYLLVRPGHPAAAPRSIVVPGRAALERMAPAAGRAALTGAAREADALTTSSVSSACRSQPPGTAARQLLISRAGYAMRLEQEVRSLVAEEGRHLAGAPGGPAAVSALSRYATAAAAAGSLYRQWLVDLQATGCYSAPTNDLHYLEASRADAAVAAAARLLQPR